MEKIFNVTGTCFPRRHYMVDLVERVAEIRKMIDRGDYFAINRGRQYGKTTTLYALRQELRKDYVVVSLDFQEMDTAMFADADVFSRSFCEFFLVSLENTGEERISEAAQEMLRDFFTSKERQSMKSLSLLLPKICNASTAPIVLIIDEVDSAANYEVFVDFLAMLRQKYLDREDVPTFQSVVLAGVNDIRHLKAKIRPDSQHKVNSPWNIAAEFRVRMWFDAKEIAGMLRQYEEDYHSGMDIDAMAGKLFEYTRGYPVMVSWLCKKMAEDLGGVFTKESLKEAVDMMINSQNVAVFGSMLHHIGLYPELKKLLKNLVYMGKKILYVPFNEPINLGLMFCYLRQEGANCAVANWIFEQFLFKYFTAEDAQGDDSLDLFRISKSQFVKEDGRLDMDRVMSKFITYYADIYGGKEDRFLEKMGRRLFMLYLKPIINGTGNCYVEAETRDETKTDLIIDFMGEQFIVELKIWRGDEYNTRGEKQLAGYLDYFHRAKGYLLSFNFNNDKQVGMRTIMVEGKTIVEAVV